MARDLAPYLQIEQSGPLLHDRVAGRQDDLAPGREAVIDFLVELNRAVQQEVAYTIRLEPGVQTPNETLGKRLGSCRD